MNRLKRYKVTASFGTSYVVAGEIQSGNWSAVIMALNKQFKAVPQLIDGKNEQDVLAQCRKWIDKNIECNAQITTEI